QFLTPAESGVVGRVVVRMLVAVAAERRLQAEGVARPEAAGPGAALEQRIPKRLRIPGPAEDFEAVLAGVTGAREDRGLARHLRLGEAEEADGFEIDRGEGLQERQG